MKKTQLSHRGIDNGHVFYGSGADVYPPGVLSIHKRVDNVLYIAWKDFSQKGITQLDALINELEPYYTKTDADGDARYLIKQGDFGYGFTVMRGSFDETVFIKKLDLRTKNDPEKSATFSGTGFAIASDGYIVTNHHVTEGASSIKVRGINGDFSKTYNAKLIVDDKNNDLSVIKIDDSNFSSLGTIPFVIPNKSCDVGCSVFCLGYPLRASMGDEVKLTNGIISSKSGFQGDVTTYQITAPIQPGNSGGPLFDDKGNLVGIINAKHLGAENVSYAIKVTYLLNLIDIMSITPKLQTVSSLSNKTLSEQVKVIKNFTYIIEVN